MIDGIKEEKYRNLKENYKDMITIKNENLEKIGMKKRN
jgi:hypothetical protein